MFRESRVKLRSKVLVALAIAIFCISSLFINSLAIAKSSGDSIQTTIALQASGSINHSVYLGAWLDPVPGGYNTWVNGTGKGLAIYASLAALEPQVPVPNNGTFQWTLTDGLQEALPLLKEGKYSAVCMTWMTTYGVSTEDAGPNGTCFQCTSEVANGTWDSVISANAIWIKNNFPYPLIIRIDQEFNLPNSFGWGENASIYVAAYQRIVNIFRDANVSNVKWSWCPNFASQTGVRFTEYYPGDSYVDWIGTDLYASTEWSNFNAMLDTTDNLNPICPYEFALTHNKPFMIAEWGLNGTGNMSNEQSAIWMQGFFDALASRPDTQMIVAWPLPQYSVLNYPQALKVYATDIVSPEFSVQYP